jgi:hypothetical protein
MTDITRIVVDDELYPGMSADDITDIAITQSSGGHCAVARGWISLPFNRPPQ